MHILKMPDKITFGMIVNCSRCLEGYTIYADIHGKRAGDMAVGMCPICNNVEGYKFQADHLYNRGEQKAHLEGENEYDWDWLEYDKPNMKQTEIGEGSYHKKSIYTGSVGSQQASWGGEMF